MPWPGAARQRRGAAHEAGELGVVRGEVDVGGGAGLDQPALAEHGDLVGQRQGLGLVVGDQQAGGLRGPQGPGDGAARRLAQRGVEGGEGLVEEDDGGARGQRAGQGDPLLLAAGELVRGAAAEGARELDEVEHLVDPGARAALAAGQPEADVGGHVEVREERALLRDVADPAVLRGHRPAGAGDDPVVEGDGARRRGSGSRR